MLFIQEKVTPFYARLTVSQYDWLQKMAGTYGTTKVNVLRGVIDSFRLNSGKALRPDRYTWLIGQSARLKCEPIEVIDSLIDNAMTSGDSL